MAIDFTRAVVPKVTVYSRIRRGWSVEDSLTTPAYAGERRAFKGSDRKEPTDADPELSKKITDLGTSKKELKAKAKEAGIHINTVYKRIRRGWKLSDLFRESGWREEATFADKARASGVNEYTARARRQRGMSEEDALNPERVDAPYSIAQKAAQAGLPYACVYGRLRRGWSEEDALSQPKHSHPNSLKKQAMEAGISPVTVYWRMRNGMTKEEALNTPLYGERTNSNNQEGES